jgi:hypothetical protein
MIKLAYSNDQTQIRAGFVSYIGTLLKSSIYKGKAAKQNVASILVEETLKIAQDDEKVIDLYVIKPMIKGIIFVFNQRIMILSKLPKSVKIEEQKKIYQSVITSLENLVSMVN